MALAGSIAQIRLCAVQVAYSSGDQLTGAGTGFILNADGLIITAKHVLDDLMSAVRGRTGHLVV